MNTKILRAIKKFNDQDKIDLWNVRIYEPTMSHRIAVYLEKEFKQYNIDCEYDKNFKDPKTNSSREIIRPDIIIHKRNNRDSPDNRVVFEIKKHWLKSKQSIQDIEKIKDYLSWPLKYKLWVFIWILKSSISVLFLSDSCSELYILKDWKWWRKCEFANENLIGHINSLPNHYYAQLQSLRFSQQD